MTGACMADNPSIARLKKRYCTLQMHKATIEDQQRSLLEIIEGYDGPKAE
jgi:hypothetical protein